MRVFSMEMRELNGLLCDKKILNYDGQYIKQLVSSSGEFHCVLSYQNDVVLARIYRVDSNVSGEVNTAQK